MRRLIPVVAVLALLLAAGIAAYHHAAAMSNGAPQLNCVQCHQDADKNPADFTVEGLPEKVEPGKEYRITVKITKGPESQGAAYGGFAAEASAGQLIVVDDKNTFIPPNSNIITHTKDGSMLREWTFAWKAPEQCSGPITIDIAVIAANGDSSPMGDAFARKKITVECAAGGAAGGQTSPTKTITTIVTETVTTTTKTTKNTGLAVGVAVLVFIVVVAGYILLARK